MKTRASVYVLAVHNNAILLTQLADYCTNGGSWSLPGGGMKFGEQPYETLVRETYEEAGLHVQEATLVHARTYSEDTERYGQFQAVQLVYKADLQGEPRVIEVGGSTAAVAWVPLDQVAELPTVGLVDAVLPLVREA